MDNPWASWDNFASMLRRVLYYSLVKRPGRTVAVSAATLAVLALAGVACRSGEQDDLLGRRTDSESLVGAPSGGAPPPANAKLTYTVAPGDTLGAIATRFGTTVDQLMAANGISDADSIHVGQLLNLTLAPQGDGPAIRALPDSELVYGPAYVDFDTLAYVGSMPGHLTRYSEMVDGRSTSGGEIVDRVAWEYSVGPRVLLAFLEARSGWVTGTPVGEGLEYPAGLVDPARSGLWWQLTWLADQLNSGYYDWKTRGSRIMRLSDGTVLAGHPELGPGSFALQRALAPQATEAALPELVAGFTESYRRLFGDPWARALEPLDVREVDFPELRLPWPDDESWWFTGGPHGGWAGGSAWAALDFVPDEEAFGCFVSGRWADAVADGRVIHGGSGQLWLDLDRDGHRETGPAVMYLHLSSLEVAESGKIVKAGDHLGHPSCEGGSSDATHLHLARMYDGEWLAAAGDSPLVLGGWRAVGATGVYDGRLIHDDGREREACECREAGYNDVAW